MRFGHILVAFFVMGSIMWAGGAITWNDAGVATLLLDEPTASGINEETAADLEKTGGPIQNALSSVGAGALIAVWNLVVKFIGYLFWPITVLANNNVPPQIWVPLGGGPTMAFYAGFIRLIRTSG